MPEAWSTIGLLPTGPYPGGAFREPVTILCSSNLELAKPALIQLASITSLASDADLGQLHPGDVVRPLITVLTLQVDYEDMGMSLGLSPSPPSISCRPCPRPLYALFAWASHRLAPYFPGRVLGFGQRRCSYPNSVRPNLWRCAEPQSMRPESSIIFWMPGRDLPRRFWRRIC